MEREKRYFDIEEANAMIPWLNHTFAGIARLRARMGLGTVAQAESLQRDIEDRLNQIVDKGIEVVDVELGIVNFYALDEDEDVVLSWQYGETEIHYWHEPFEDFCHRRPLKQLTTEAPKAGPAIH
jgi:hypothetical protein